MFSGLQIIKESFLLSIQQLWSNKLRAFLSLLGITIGIFSIIAILTAVDALKNDISSSISKLGDNILFVGKWPWTFTSSNYPWWEYVKRPEPKYNDYKLLNDRLTKAEAVSYSISPPNPKPTYLVDEISNVEVVGITQDYGKVMQLELAYGRYFSLSESNLGLPVAVIGGGIAPEVFNSSGADAIDREIKVWGRKVKIIGVIKKEGQGGLLGFNNDKSIYVPYFFVNKVQKADLGVSKPQIQVRAKNGVTLDELSLDIQTQMRAIHKLRPKKADDFSINQMSIIANSFEGVFTALNTVGWVVGFFALIVGGFGIANIMYVSVSERTNIIGIKKAIGAKKRHILSEFLIESVLLCVMGGLIGLIMVFTLTDIATNTTGMEFALSWKNSFIGLSISIIIGLLSGYLPALSAANLDAVEAIRAK
jgi:putative ABC transport system permease protein